MTVREFLLAESARLEWSETPFLDACLVLSHCLGISREALLARLPEDLVSPPRGFAEAWERRISGESIAYITGSKEFFGRSFVVDRRVLVPRPDTETLVVAALEAGDRLRAESGREPCVHDVCTGSGIVAISLAAERPRWNISASDISLDALDVAALNARRLLPSALPLRQANLLEGVEGSFDIITANPPYVPSGETRQLLAQGWAEPVLALDGGADGLDVIRLLIAQARGRLRSGGFLLIEADALQSREVCAIFSLHGYREPRVWKDLAGLERVTGASVP